MNGLTFVAALKLLLSTPENPSLNMQAYDGSYALRKALPMLGEIVTKISSLNTKTHEIGFAEKVLDYLGNYWNEHSCAPSLQMCSDWTLRNTYRTDLYMDHQDKDGMLSPEETEQGWRLYSTVSSMVGPYTPDDIVSILTNMLEEINTFSIKNGITSFMQATANGLRPEALDALQGEIQKARNVQNVDSWEHTESKDDMYRRYWELWNARKIPMYTGFPSIDEATMGFACSDMVALLGATGHGKSTLTIQMAYHALLLGLRGLYISLEMPCDVVSARFISIHSGHPKFAGIGKPVSAKAILKGTLDFKTDSSFIFDTVIPDFNSMVGKLKVIPRPGSQFGWEELERVLLEEDSDPAQPLHYFVVDHPDLMDKPAKRGAAAFQNTDELYKQIRRITLYHNKGTGITALLPVQANSKGVEAADKNDGIYSLTGIATSSEIAKSCTHIYYISSFPEMKENNECLIGCLKDRDGGSMQRFRASVHPVTGSIEEITSPAPIPGMGPLGSGFGVFTL